MCHNKYLWMCCVLTVLAPQQATTMACQRQHHCANHCATSYLPGRACARRASIIWSTTVVSRTFNSKLQVFVTAALLNRANAFIRENQDNSPISLIENNGRLTFLHRKIYRKTVPYMSKGKKRTKKGGWTSSRECDQPHSPHIAHRNR